PSPGEDLERMRLWRLLHDLNVDIQFIMSTPDELASERTIGPQLPNRGDRTVQCRQEHPPAISILNVGGKHQDGQDQAEHIYQNIPLPPHDLLACVIAARTAHLRRLHRLAVNHSSRRLGLALFLLSNLTTQSIVDPLPGFVPLPSAKVVVDQLPLR